MTSILLQANADHLEKSSRFLHHHIHWKLLGRQTNTEQQPNPVINGDRKHQSEVENEDTSSIPYPSLLQKVCQENLRGT